MVDLTMLSNAKHCLTVLSLNIAQQCLTMLSPNVNGNVNVIYNYLYAEKFFDLYGSLRSPGLACGQPQGKQL